MNPEPPQKTKKSEALSEVTVGDDSLDDLAALCELAADSPTPVQRRRFYEKLRVEISRANRGLSIVSLVLLRWADQKTRTAVAQLVADLSSALREYDVVRQVASDTLALIMPGAGKIDCSAVVARLAQSHAQSLQIGHSTWAPGLDAMDLLAEARASLNDEAVVLEPGSRTRSRILLWVDGLPCALPVQAEPRPGGLELRLMLPTLAGAEVNLSGGPVNWPCRVDELSFDDGQTLRMKVTGVRQ